MCLSTDKRLIEERENVMNENDLKLYKVMGGMLRDRRIEKDLTLEQVALGVNMTAKTIQRYEAGERKINISVLVKITDLLGLDYYDFSRQVQGKTFGTQNIIEVAKPQLSPLDIEIVKAFENATEDQKRKILEYAMFLNSLKS